MSIIKRRSIYQSIDLTCKKNKRNCKKTTSMAVLIVVPSTPTNISKILIEKQITTNNDIYFVILNKTKNVERKYRCKRQQYCFFSRVKRVLHTTLL